ncbi:Uncharacterised protein [uncultured archaeon]|nr:Uncharacterised protein [uncultured archaeon]
MISSSIAPEVVTKIFGIPSLQSWLKNPLNPEVTILDVKVKNIFALFLFILRTTLTASESSVA